MQINYVVQVGYILKWFQRITWNSTIKVIDIIIIHFNVNEYNKTISQLYSGCLIHEAYK